MSSRCFPRPTASHEALGPSGLPGSWVMCSVSRALSMQWEGHCTPRPRSVCSCGASRRGSLCSFAEVSLPSHARDGAVRLLGTVLVLTVGHGTDPKLLPRRHPGFEFCLPFLTKWSCRVPVGCARSGRAGQAVMSQESCMGSVPMHIQTHEPLGTRSPRPWGSLNSCCGLSPFPCFLWISTDV